MRSWLASRSVTVAVHVLRGLPSGWWLWSAMAWGRMARATSAAGKWVGDGELRPGVEAHGALAGGRAVEEVDADELGDVARGRPGRDVRRDAGLGDMPPLDDDEAVGEDERVHRVVRDEESGALKRGEVAAELGTDLDAGAGVEGGEGLVEEQQSGVRGERTGEGDTLGLAAGEGAGLGVGLLGEGEPLEPFTCPAAGAGLVLASGAEPEGDVVERAEPGEEQVVLEHDADGAFGGGDEHVGGGVVEHGAVELDAAVVERLEAGDDAQRGGLAGAVGPEQRDDLAVADVEVDVEPEVAELDLDGRVEHVRRTATGRGAGGARLGTRR